MWTLAMITMIRATHSQGCNMKMKYLDQAIETHTQKNNSKSSYNIFI